jgi:non-canonical poly(A) RNA polymerase PAPD5/7
LHKEIIDFHEWVKPKDYERAVRQEVFDRLRKILRRFKPGGELCAFGSFAVGLYLPTGDMDLVYLTSQHRPGTMSKQRSGALVMSFARYIRQMGIADSVVAIAKSKVPIVKFVDRISGIKIDLSFDNDTGIAAVRTFDKWKAEYAIMPIIVSVIKQFLMIRGLNDVSTNGLGGFSTICLVTSLLQHLPPAKPPANLGSVLLEFFNYYGNLFDRSAVVIRMEPPAYLDKVRSYKRRIS